jgi:hypothetical protein
VLLFFSQDIHQRPVHVSGVVSVSVPNRRHTFDEVCLFLVEQTETSCKRNLSYASTDRQPGDKRLKAPNWHPIARDRPILTGINRAGASDKAQ